MRSTHSSNSNALEQKDFIDAIEALGISGTDVCIHSSIRSFGADIRCGIDGMIDAFLQTDCTILTPAFCDAYEAKPIARFMPKQNGAGDYSYFFGKKYDPKMVYDVSSKEITIEEMGLFARHVLARKESVRGNNALNSFTALGKNASDLICHQTNRDVYAPLKQLCEYNGYVLLMGVGLDSATIIHYAETVAGRIPFIRWAYDKEYNVIPVSAGSCSDGFENFRDVLKSCAKEIKVANSRWFCCRARDIVDICSAQMKSNPRITHCGDPQCDRCNDAVAGGPMLDESFWKI